MTRRRKAQAWSMDFAFSLVIFTVACGLSYTLIVNTLQEDGFAEVNNEAVAAASALNLEGYPIHWTNDTVIRAGLRSDDHLSLRKAAELAKLSDQQVRGVLRTVDNVYIYFTNETGGTEPVFGDCGIGSLTAVRIEQNISIPAAVLRLTAHNVSDKTGLTQLTPDNAYTNLSQYDVLVLEGNLSSKGQTSGDQATLNLESAAKRGITVFIIGDPGIAALGVHVNESLVQDITMQADALNMTTNDIVNVSDSPISLATIDQPTGQAVTHFEKLGISELGKIAYATWLYEDARVYYVASSEGNNTVARRWVSDSLATAINRSVIVPRPICQPVEQPDAKQRAVHTRTLAYHEHLLTLNVLVWRNR